METILSLYDKQKRTLNGTDTAIRWINSSLTCQQITWDEIEKESNRRAAFLAKKQCQQGDHVFIFLQSSPEIWFFFLGALKCGAVPCVLFPNFGEDAIRSRLVIGKAAYLITDTSFTKFEDLFLSISTIRAIVYVDGIGKPLSTNDRLLRFDKESAFVYDHFIPSKVDPDDPAFMVFTSGSTGFPKAVIHAHRIAESIQRSMRNVLQIGKDDLFWCTAHPAWITGTVYSILGPLLCRIESVQYSGNFHAKRWMPILQNQRVAVWYSAPTAFRSLMQESPDFYKEYDFSALKEIFSIGEPLNPVVFFWGKAIFNRDIHDTWFQTEAGTIRIANIPGNAIKPGFMGKAVDDAFPVILNEHNQSVPPNEVGRLCLKEGWESCFIDYFEQRSAFASKFQSGYYETGDLAYQDDEGYFCFVGRDDDVINTSGHLVGPFEVESVLLSQDEIADVGVVAAPDDLLYEKVAAFIVLKNGFIWNDKLETKMRIAVTSHLSPIATPKLFIIVDEIPRNNAGKILRNVLRERLKP